MDELCATCRFIENHGICDSCRDDDKYEQKFPQDEENDECRYLIAQWLLKMSEGLTKGARKHPGASWKTIPPREHAWRAVRHLLKYIAGDNEDDHLTNASMRIMMAWETDRNEAEKICSFSITNDPPIYR